jgi:hypothetical protein
MDRHFRAASGGGSEAGRIKLRAIRSLLTEHKPIAVAPLAIH